MHFHFQALYHFMMHSTFFFELSASSAIPCNRRYKSLSNGAIEIAKNRNDLMAQIIEMMASGSLVTSDGIQYNYQFNKLNSIH